MESQAEALGAARGPIRTTGDRPASSPPLRVRASDYSCDHEDGDSKDYTRTTNTCDHEKGDRKGSERVAPRRPRRTYAAARLSKGEGTRPSHVRGVEPVHPGRAMPAVHHQFHCQAQG